MGESKLRNAELPVALESQKGAAEEAEEFAEQVKAEKQEKRYEHERKDGMRGREPS